MSPEQIIKNISLLPTFGMYGMQSQQLRDTTPLSGMIDDLNYAGNGQYYDYNQLSQEMAGLRTPSVKKSDVQALSSGQRVMNTAGSVISGAKIGSQFGPVGGVVGGIGGLVYGALTNMQGAFAEDVQQDYLNEQAREATQNAQNNYISATENLSNQIARNRAANVSRDGGEIERKQLSAKDFADIVLKKKSVNDVTRSSGVVRKRCDGGLMIRIKR